MWLIALGSASHTANASSRVSHTSCEPTEIFSIESVKLVSTVAAVEPAGCSEPGVLSAVESFGVFMVLVVRPVADPGRWTI